MSQTKNTALGSVVSIGYSHVVPATHRPTTALMITVALVFAALVVLACLVSAGTEDYE